MAGTEQNRIPEWTHVQSLTCTTQTNLYWTANNRSEYAPQCTQRQGWSSDNSTCKTTAAKFTKCLEFKSVWHCSLARTNQRQPVCTHVEVRSPPATFVPGVVNSTPSFRVRSGRCDTTNIFYNLFILQDASNVFNLPRSSVMSIEESKPCGSEGRHENTSGC